MGCSGSNQKSTGSGSSCSLSSLTDNDYMESIKPELCDTTIDNLLTKTKFTKEDILNWWYGFLADCPSGVLRKKTFFKVYQHRYPNGNAKNFCNHVFRTFNPDKRTGAIDFERFMCAIDITMNGTDDQKLEWAFKMYDINNDQLISKKEMLNVIESMFDLLGKERKGSNLRYQVDKIFSNMDTDGRNYITKKQFLIACKDENIRAILAPHY